MTERQTQIVGVDSQAITWGMREVKTDNPEMEKRARWLFEYLDAIKCEVVIPTVALAELLVNVAPEQRMGFVNHLKKSFCLKEFDVQSAVLVACQTKATYDLKEHSTPDARITYKADLMIVASAKVFGAEVFTATIGGAGNWPKGLGWKAWIYRPDLSAPRNRAGQIPCFQD